MPHSTPTTARVRLRDPGKLVRLMQAQDCTQARLARSAGCSRQFVHQLINGQRETCSREVADRIEEALRMLPRTLFVPELSSATRQVVASQVTGGAA